MRFSFEISGLTYVNSPPFRIKIIRFEMVHSIPKLIVLISVEQLGMIYLMMEKGRFCFMEKYYNGYCCWRDLVFYLWKSRQSSWNNIKQLKKTFVSMNNFRGNKKYGDNKLLRKHVNSINLLFENRYLVLLYN